MAQNFEIQGGQPLTGAITVNTSKNAAVALLAASVMNRGTTTLHNVPQIEEVNRWLEVLGSIGMQITQDGRTIVLTPPEAFDIAAIDAAAAKKTRSAILLLGALAGHKDSYKIPQAGGCRLGVRTITPHVRGLAPFGIVAEVTEEDFTVTVAEISDITEPVVLTESGDTVTENVLFAAAQRSGVTEIHFASPNYMVQEVCFFLELCGVRIEGIGTKSLRVHGVGAVNKDVTYTIGEDPIEAMFFIAIAIVTKSAITIKRCPIDFLELELARLSEMGFVYKRTPRYKAHNGHTDLVDIITTPSELVAPVDKIHPMPFPGINIDNFPFFAPIAAVAEGKTLLHDWLYENRSVYFQELERLGADVELLDPHRVYITGPTKWHSATMNCPPALRPGAVLLVAMLAAEGTSVLKDIYMINRGYEDLAVRLQELGARITIVEQ